MSDRANVAFMHGVSRTPLNEYHGEAEEKSPPLKTLQPHRDQYFLVDPARYTSPGMMEKEWDSLWPKVWINAGRVSDLPTEGSWLRFDVGQESFIIVRNGAQHFTAFYNVCPHRGNRLVDDDFGKQKRFVCMYHGWSFDQYGNNFKITDREYFDQRALCGNLNLIPVLCETWGGNIFIKMDEGGPSLSEYLGDIANILAPYKMETMHVVQDTVLDMNCNWKVAMDAFSEGYHVHATHPQALGAAEDLKIQIDYYKGGHGRFIIPWYIPSSRRQGNHALAPALRMLLEDIGIDPDAHTSDTSGARRAAVEHKRRPDNDLGIDYSGFTDSQLVDSWVINIFPNTQLSMHPEGVLVLRFLPHPNEPAKCLAYIAVVLPKLKPGKRAPFYFGVASDVDISGDTRPPRRRITADDPNLKEVIGELLWQDVRNTRETQRGMSSRAFKAVRLSEQESRIQHQHAEIDRYLDPEMVARMITEAGEKSNS